MLLTRAFPCERHTGTCRGSDVQKHEISLAKYTSDAQHHNTIDQSTIGTFFTPIADRLLNSTGSVSSLTFTVTMHTKIAVDWGSNYANL